MTRKVPTVAFATALLACSGHGKDPTVAPLPKRDASPVTQADVPLAGRYKACWTSYNAGNWDELRACYVPTAPIDPGMDGRQLFDVDAKLDADKKTRAGFPKTHADLDLVIVADDTIIGVVHMTGQTELYMADVVEYDEHGRIKREDIYRDALGEPRPLPAALIGSSTVVTGTGADIEERNPGVVEQFIDSVEHHISAKPLEESLAADLVWSERWLDQDLTRPALVDFMSQLRRGFDRLDYVGGTTWTAGNFVVRRSHEEGTPSDMPWLGIAGDPHESVSIPALTIFRLDHGHIKAALEFWTIGALYTQLGIKPPSNTPSLPASKK